MCSAMRHISPAPPGSRLSWCPSIHRAMGDPECTLSSRICALAGCSAPGQACRCCQAFHDINRIPNRATFGLGVADQPNAGFDHVSPLGTRHVSCQPQTPVSAIVESQWQQGVMPVSQAHFCLTASSCDDKLLWNKKLNATIRFFSG
jgi:hypothetical protein